MRLAIPALKQMLSVHLARTHFFGLKMTAASASVHVQTLFLTTLVTQ